MSHPGLVAALRRKADEDVAAIWQHARAEAAKLQTEAAGAIEAERAEAARALAVAAEQATITTKFDAEAKARSLRVAMKVALADRLYALAREALSRLRDDRYAELFAALVQELPPRDWQQVTVNPADQHLAERHFPAAEVVCDPGICGGLAVAAEAGRVRISNTLETRLQAAWPDLLPDLMRSILRECTDQRVAP